MEIDTEGVTNDKLNIKINTNDEIIQYAIVGGVGDEGIFISYDVVPENFTTDFKNGYFLYKDGVISVNPNFEPSHDIE